MTRHGIELASADANGNVVAAYTYNAFGRTISQSGPLADVFRHRFSTKYFDVETRNSTTMVIGSIRLNYTVG